MIGDDTLFQLLASLFHSLFDFQNLACLYSMFYMYAIDDT